MHWHLTHFDGFSGEVVPFSAQTSKRTELAVYCILYHKPGIESICIWGVYYRRLWEMTFMFQKYTYITYTEEQYNSHHWDSVLQADLSRHQRNANAEFYYRGSLYKSTHDRKTAESRIFSFFHVESLVLVVLWSPSCMGWNYCLLDCSRGETVVQHKNCC